MREAVTRSNSVITNLQHYAKSFELNSKDIVVANLIESLIVLYRPQCMENRIEIKLQLDKTVILNGDGNYLGQAFENIIKNAVEAQPVGGFIIIQLVKNKKECVIRFENPCTTLNPDDAEMTLKPYFTTKTYGTGLGLAISRKIIELHSGKVTTDFKNGMFSVSATFLLNHGAGNAKGYL
jgi:signal transduction histidine kinase